MTDGVIDFALKARHMGVVASTRPSALRPREGVFAFLPGAT
jgi:hypothetical protein